MKGQDRKRRCRGREDGRDNTKVRSEDENEKKKR